MVDIGENEWVKRSGKILLLLVCFYYPIYIPHIKSYARRQSQMLLQCLSVMTTCSGFRNCIIKRFAETIEQNICLYVAVFKLGFWVYVWILFICIGWILGFRFPSLSKYIGWIPQLFWEILKIDFVNIINFIIWYLVDLKGYCFEILLILWFFNPFREDETWSLSNY